MPNHVRAARSLGLLVLVLACVPGVGGDVVPPSTGPPPPAGAAGPPSPVFGPPMSAMEVLAGPARPSDLDVMTFNLRYAGSAGANTWAQRRPVMRTLLTLEQPDLIGTQEGLPDQVRDVAADLGEGYAHFGLGREGGDNGEHMAIFYNTARLRVLRSGDFWLSATPQVPGSISWGSAHVRMVTWALFTDRSSGHRFFAVNTHLDNVSENARRHAAELIMTTLAGFEKLPVVLTGDFNSPGDGTSQVHRLLTGRAGLRDTWTTAPIRGPAWATIHNYQALVPDGERDDWILTTPDVTASAILMNTYRDHGQYPSDHLPVQVRVRLP
ncbi:endonuclease/exonuclease/phosphatase family protein [Actinoplanes sp. HUAS TT8]|uniref:endonuclease/exonuclease/phosphatase family protein n=1 Tax=Actinoplanes sp. HUAS TT8 TaxID=3447453 RepID=UPI003F51C400